MAASDHNFRYLVKPGTDFAFVSKFRLWIAMSGLLITISIASLFVNKAVRGSYLNWTIDFKGGTEIIYKFKDRAKPDSYVYADAGKVRAALSEAGAEGFDVSEMTWTEEVGDKENTVRGAMVRTPRFGAMTPAQQKAAGDAFAAKFADRGIDSMQWSGDRLFVRSKAHITDAEAGEVFKASGLEIKPWGASAALYSVPDEGTGEYKQTFAMFGLDRQYELVLEKALPEVDVVTEATSQVSAKAGAELRNEGIKALFYAMLLITLTWRCAFDVRYAPGDPGDDARRDHGHRRLLGDLDRRVADLGGRAADGHRLLGQRHRRDLRPHPREPGQAQGQAPRAHRRHLAQRGRRALDLDLGHGVRGDADHERVRHRPGAQLRLRDERRHHHRRVLLDLPGAPGVPVGIEALL
jgi:preprotein translocase subunit SecF